jgi:ABC-type glycerol-3-phosphate transport system permease component
MDTFRLRRALPAIGLNASVLLLAGVMLVPFLVMLSWSFKPLGEIFSVPVYLVPRQPTLDNYVDLFTQARFERFFINSIVAAAGFTTLGLLWCAMGGWALSQYHARINGPLLLVLVAVIALPFQAIIVSAYLLVVNLKLSNSLLALIIPFSASAYGILFLRQYMLSLPREVFEAGRIDGATELRIWWSLALPMTRPGLAALGIFLFLDSWNDFLWPLIILQETDKLTYPVGLYTLVGLFKVEYGQMMAASTLALIPIAAILLFLQRHFVTGLTLGARR